MIVLLQGIRVRLSETMKPGDKIAINSEMGAGSGLRISKGDLRPNMSYELRVSYYGYDALKFDITLVCEAAAGAVGVDEISGSRKSRNRVLDNYNFYYKTDARANF